MPPEPYTVGDRVTVRNTPMLADLGLAGLRGELVNVVGPVGNQVCELRLPDGEVVAVRSEWISTEVGK